MGSLLRTVRVMAAAGGLLVGLMALPAASAQEVVVARIHDVQGATHLSPFSGQDVAGVEGIVTVERSSQFWMQDPTPTATRRAPRASWCSARGSARWSTSATT